MIGTDAKSGPIQVQLASESREALRAIKSLASVPNLFAAGGPDSDVALVSGRDLVSNRTAIEADATRFVVLVEPGQLGQGELEWLRSLQEGGSVTVVVASRYSTRLDELASAADPIVLPASLVTARVTIAERDARSFRDGLTDGLGVVRSLAGPIRTVRQVHRTDSTTVIECQTEALGDTPAIVTCHASSIAPHRLEVDVVGLSERTSIGVDDMATASPLRWVRHDASGAHQTKSVFQGGHRSMWVRAHSVAKGADQIDDLAVFATSWGLLEGALTYSRRRRTS